MPRASELKSLIDQRTRREAIQICQTVAMTPELSPVRANALDTNVRVYRFCVAEARGYTKKSQTLAYRAVSALAPFSISGELDRRLLHARAAQNLANGWEPGDSDPADNWTA